MIAWNMRQIIGMLLYSCKLRNIFEENTHPLKRGQYPAKLQLIFKTVNLQNVTEKEKKQGVLVNYRMTEATK